MNLRSKLFVTFLSITMAAMLLSSWVFYHQFKEILYDNAEERLQIISQIQTSRIRDFITDKKVNILRIKNRPELLRRLQRYIDEPGQRNYSRLEHILVAMVGIVPDVRNFSILNASGHVIASGSGEYIGERVLIPSGGPLAGLPMRNELKQDAVPSLFLSEKMRLPDGEVYTLLMESSLADMYSMIKEYHATSETGESVIVQYGSDSITYISPLRFSDSFFAKTATGNDQLSSAPFRGVNGFVDHLTDYNGNDVFAHVQTVPGTRWALSTKINKSEVLAPVAKLRNVVIVATVIILLASMIITLFYSRYTIRDLLVLEDAVRNFGQGKRWKRVEHKGSDEVGLLTESFNSMAVKLEETTRELEEQVSLLRKSNENLDSFAYIISHDLKAPLRGIGTLASMIEEDFKDKLDESDLKMLEMMKERVSHLDRMILGVLNYSRVGRKNKMIEEFCVDDVVKQVINSIEVPEKASLRLHLKGSKLRMDRTAFWQLIQNLVSNAIKYGNEENPQIEIEETEEEGMIHLEVKDNGPGIPDKYKGRLFQVFGTLPGNRKADSTGVGLAIVKKIVDANGGKYGVRNNPGGGSTFWVDLPRDNIRS